VKALLTSPTFWCLAAIFGAVCVFLLPAIGDVRDQQGIVDDILDSDNEYEP
jgi:hypothetical protein